MDPIGQLETFESLGGWGNSDFVGEIQSPIEGRVETGSRREECWGGDASKGELLLWWCWSRRGTCLRLLLNLLLLSWLRIGRLCLWSLILSSISTTTASSSPRSISSLLLLEGGLVRTALNCADLLSLVLSAGSVSLSLFPGQDDVFPQRGWIHLGDILLPE